MAAHDQTDLASAILTELPHLRAYARLMTNDRSEAEREVEATIESASGDDIGCSDKAQLRVSLFRILRGFLAAISAPCFNGMCPTHTAAFVATMPQ